MHCRRTCCGTRGLRTRDVTQRPAAKEFTPVAQSQIWQRAHVLRFFLHPDNARLGGVGFERLAQKFFLQWIELFEADYGDVRAMTSFARFQQVEVDFAAT